MERFQRAKLERQAIGIRRELTAWLDTYRGIAVDNGSWASDKKWVELACMRATYLEHLVEVAHKLEDGLAKEHMP
jgi:hypothetical protein